MQRSIYRCYNTHRNMNNDEKILKALEDLQADITAMKHEMEKIPTIEKQLTQQRKILNEVAANMGTVLTEQQAQRIDIRSLHTDLQSLHSEVHASKEELKSEIIASRADAKRDNMDLKATVGKQFKGHEERIDTLEDDAGIPH